MDKTTFQIMYSALVEIAAAQTFFEGEKKLAAIAKKALKQIANNDQTSTPQN